MFFLWQPIPAGAESAAASGEAVASAAGTSTVSGVSSALKASLLASTGIATVLGVSAAGKASVAASSGVATVSGISAAAKAAVANSAGTSTATAVGSSATTTEAVASAAGTSTVSGISEATKAAVASSAGTSTASAVGDSTSTTAATGGAVGGWIVAHHKGDEVAWFTRKRFERLLDEIRAEREKEAELARREKRKRATVAALDDVYDDVKGAYSRLSGANAALRRELVIYLARVESAIASPVLDVSELLIDLPSSILDVRSFESARLLADAAIKRAERAARKQRIADEYWLLQNEDDEDEAIALLLLH